MTKIQFLSALEERISGLDDKEVKKTLDYYSEMLDDYAEDGLDTDAAIERMGGIDAIAASITGSSKQKKQTEASENARKPDTGATSVTKATEKSSAKGEGSKASRVIKYILIGVLYFSSLIAILTVWTLAVSLIFSAPTVAVAGIVSIATGSAAFGFVQIGAALIIAAIAIFIGIIAFFLTGKAFKLIRKKIKK